MRRFPLLYSAITLSLFILFVSASPLCAQKSGSPNPTRPVPSPGVGQSQMYSVSGMVSDAQSHSALNSIRVELRSFGGGTVASGFTSGNGNFELPNVPNGSYELVVEGSGYQDAQMRVDVRGDLHGVAVDLRPIPTSSGAAVGGATVSKRELSIPRNAHEDMQKGLALLNGKSDFQGSIKQFQRAVREYPDYYEAYTAMGIAYIRSGDAANAEQSLRKALDQSEQKYGDALYWLALLMSNGQKFADAEPLARKAVELNANSWEANSELARALDGLGHPVEAETSALAAIKLRPDNGNLYLILANIHIELDKKQALVDDLNAYLKLAPSGQFASQAREQRDQVQKELQSTQASPSTPAGNNP